jgi:hypothetical protein
MKFSSRSAPASGSRAPLSGALLLALLAMACVVGCVADQGAMHAAAPPTDPRVLAADLNARLDALQRQSEPASDDVIASLERTLREQREKRARALVAANPAGSSAGVAALSAPPRPAAAASPTKPVHLTKAQARAASAAAARSAAAAKKAAAAPLPAPVADAGVASTATPLPPLRAVDQVPAPGVVRTTAATVMGPSRTPMSRTTESHLPVDDLYERARALEMQFQVIPAIGLYREASQRGHAPSSQRLMELYADGAPGVARDYRVAVFFKERAVQQGASFDPFWRR